MAYKVFLAPTGSGNIIFEGDVLNGRTDREGKNVHVQFFSNDRGYTAALFKEIDQQGARSLCLELKALLHAHADHPGKFEVDSENRNFRLIREFPQAPYLVLCCKGNDRLQGRSYHRGDAEALRKVVEEFEKVVQTIEDATKGKGPSE